MLRQRGVFAVAVFFLSFAVFQGCDKSAGPPPTISAASQEGFGYGGLKNTEGKPATGTRPLMVLLINDSRNPNPISHSTDYYDELFFGSGNNLNVVDYFSAMSSGKFTWSRAAVIGPLETTLPDDMFASNNEFRKTSHYMQTAINAGINFVQYDKDGNGVVTVDELTVAIVENDADKPTNGANRGPSPCPVQHNADTDQDVRICSGGVLLATYVGIATIAHELAHDLEAKDIYGSGLSGNYTLMGATLYAALDDRQVYHLDPHYRMRLGWMKPREDVIGPINLSESGSEGIYGSCTTISPPQVGDIESSNPILLRDPSRNNEMLMLDYRDPGLGGYDANVPSRGLGIWYVKTNDQFVYDTINPGSRNICLEINGVNTCGRCLRVDGVVSCSQDETNFLLFPTGGKPGNGRLWNNSDGLFTFDWPPLSYPNPLATNPAPSPTPVPTNVFFGVSPQPYAGSLFEVEYATGAPLVPRMDEDLPDITASPGELITISGVFGVDDFNKRTVNFRWTGINQESLHGREMEIKSWRCNEIQAYIDPRDGAGEYEIRVYSDSTRDAQYINFQRVTIAENAPTVEIKYPRKGEENNFSENVPIALEGKSSVSGVGSLEDSQVTWYLDGEYHTVGHEKEIPAGRLSPGMHEIKFEGTNGAATVFDTVNINIIEFVASPPPGGGSPVNNSPTARITSHYDDDTVLAGAGKIVIFTGTGVDPEDGPLSGASLTWEIHNNDPDSVGFQTGSGDSISTWFTGDCSGKSYRIELTVTDSKGASDTFIININATSLC